MAFAIKVEVRGGRRFSYSPHKRRCCANCTSARSAAARVSHQGTAC